MAKASRGGKRSGAGGGAGGITIMEEDFPEAFADGVDFQASFDVDHDMRTVSPELRREWEEFAEGYDDALTRHELQSIQKEYDSSTGRVYGYIRTSNAMAINEKLYDERNFGKTDEEIFTRRDEYGVLRDLETVQNLDKAINSNVTKKDASYTRFCSDGAVQATFGLSDSQMAMLTNASKMSESQLLDLNSALVGTTSYSRSYTSTSANRSMNAFSGFTFERKINVGAGTNAYVSKRNAQESEVVFGRGMKTSVMGITVDGNHIVIHERFEGYE